jgi:hypothetical protein
MNDQVDAIGLVGQLLDTIMHGQASPEPQPAERSPEYVPYDRPARDNDWMTW